MGEQRKIPRAPAGAGKRGGAFWRAVLGRYELELGEMELLTALVQLLGRCEVLQQAIDDEGELIPGRFGTPQVHPALVEVRQSAVTISRIIGQLALPHPDGSVVPSAITARNRKGAEAQRAQRAAEAGSVSAMATNAIMARWHPNTGA
jgi:hypothetical protein